MKKILSLLLVTTFLCLSFCIPVFAADQSQRPVWIISHQCNSPAEHVRAAIDAGVNAIEVDVRYSFSQGSWVLNHNAFGCQWADKLSDLFAQPGLGDQICLILFDIKEPEYIVNQDLVGTTHDLMNRYGISSEDLYIVYSVSSLDSVTDYFISGFLNSLGSNEGICVDYENDVSAVSNAFRNKGFDRTWYANGIFSGLDVTGNIKASCLEAAMRRDRGEFKKVESWTVSDNGSTGFKARLIDWGCDAIIVGDSARDNALYYLSSRELSSVRLATSEDNPFEYYGPSSNHTGSLISEGSLWIIIAVVIVAAAASVVLVNKKKKA